MSKRNQLKYIKTAVLPQDWLESELPEVALAGRSNSGKSSFLNSLAGTLIAHVSRKPGKTGTLNFYSMGESYNLVDMPGFGYAERDNETVATWKLMVEEYIEHRENLVGLVLFMDIRRELGDLEYALMEWGASLALPVVFALTKSDKMKKSEVIFAVQTLQKTIPGLTVAPISSLNNEGVVELEKLIFKKLIRQEI